MEEIEVTSEKRRSFAGTLKEMILFILRMGIAVGIIGWLVYKNYPDLMKALDHFNYYWLIPAVILYTLHLFVSAWRWRVLLDLQSIRISFIETLSLTMQGFFFSLVLPGGSLGGDVVKGAAITKRAPEGKKLTGAFTILIDRVLGMISLFSLAGIAGLISYRFLAGLSGMMEIIFYYLIFGCTVCFGAAIVLFFHRYLEKIKLIKWLLEIADKISKGMINRLMNAMDCFKNAWPVLLKIMAVNIIFIHIVLAGVGYCIARGINTPDIEPEIYILGTSLGNAAGSIPMTPAGTGTRDWVFEKVFSAAFMSDDPELSHKNASGMALAIALIFTGMMLSFNLSGGLFFIFDKSGKSQMSRREITEKD
jgi:uncharacterized protein (TIRG00374 family)